MSNSIETQAEHPHIVGYGTFIRVWAALAALTLALVGVSATHNKALMVLGLLAITPTKASLVFYYFMHLKYESPPLKYMVAITLGVLMIFLVLTFSDYLFR
jgi:cytochrome c oxidase subunit 4